LAKDVGRSIDYLAERGDMDMDKLTYYGFSWGSFQGPIFLATESDRIKFAMLFVGGLIGDNLLHERVDPIHYLPHIRMPVLMINGTMDSIFPFETSAKPMYDLLGSEDKKLITFAGGHNLWGLVGTEVKGDILRWMDDRLGPVE
jgi:dienelactone hydrolase